MKITKQRSIAWGTLGVLSSAVLGGATFAPAQADADTWKKAAIGAGAVTAYGLIKGKGKVATIGGIATAGTYLKYRHDRRKESREEARRANWYRQRYGRNWQRYYRPGA